MGVHACCMRRPDGWLHSCHEATPCFEVLMQGLAHALPCWLALQVLPGIRLHRSTANTYLKSPPQQLSVLQHCLLHSLHLLLWRGADTPSLVRAFLTPSDAPEAVMAAAAAEATAAAAAAVAAAARGMRDPRKRVRFEDEERGEEDEEGESGEGSEDEEDEEEQTGAKRARAGRAPWGEVVRYIGSKASACRLLTVESQVVFGPQGLAPDERREFDLQVWMYGEGRSVLVGARSKVAEARPVKHACFTAYF